MAFGGAFEAEATGASFDRLDPLGSAAITLVRGSAKETLQEAFAGTRAASEERGVFPWGNATVAKVVHVLPPSAEVDVAGGKSHPAFGAMVKQPAGVV